jgi:hypothetical protein
MLTGVGYVTTNANGDFSITSHYTCRAGDLVYLEARGGNPGLANGTNNSALILETALGPCSGLTSSETVQVNEVTTVAMVYALNGFESGPNTVGSGSSAAALGGIANAFQMAKLLADPATGLATAENTAGPTVVPGSEINTLANVLAACVNTNGTDGTCQQLFDATTPTYLYGAPPTNTLQAMVNIANGPGNNVATIFGLAAANAPFQPALTAAPNDWTVAVNFGRGQVAGQSVAIDAAGDAWLAQAGPASSSVAELSPMGVMMTPVTASGMVGPVGVALDAAGDVWTADSGLVTGVQTVPANLAEVSAGGVQMSPAGGYPVPGVLAVALDGSGNAWGASASGLTEVGSGAVLRTVQVPGAAVALDSNGDAWVVNGSTATQVAPDGSVASTTGIDGGSGGAKAVAVGAQYVWTAGTSAITAMDFTGAVQTPAGGLTGGGTNGPVGMAVDGYESVYVANAGSPCISEFLVDGTVQSPGTGYTSPYLQRPTGIGVDASGNVWASDAVNGAVVFLGLGNPTVTPVALGVKSGMLGMLP